MKYKLSKILFYMLMVLCICLLTWIIASCIVIMKHSLTPGYSYPWWNVFSLLLP